MFGLGLPELSIVFIFVLIIFGASKLPSIGAGLGRGIRNFRRSVSGTERSPDKEKYR